MAADLSYEEAQEVVDEGDVVTASEIQEMYPDKTMNQIQYDMAMEEAELELKSKMQEKYEFNEPRAAAKQGRKTYHTGPKGVLTDYEEAKLKLRANRIADKMRREHKYYMNIGNNSNETQSKLMIIDMKKNKAVNTKELRKERKVSLSESDEDDEDEEDEDAEDEEVLLRYKLEKMRILKENAARYGDTKELTAWTFSQQVENAAFNVFVVVHVYQDYLERCGRMNYAMAQIAKSYPHIKFLRARSDRLGLDNYPQIGLPTFIIFKNGKQLQNHIAVHQLIPNPFQVKDVEAFLIKNKVIQPVVIIPDVKTNNNNNNKNKNKNKNNNDSDSGSGSELDLD